MKLQEFNRRDFLSDTDDGSKTRSKDIPYVHYSGIDQTYAVYFTARSASGNGSYDVKIQLVDYPDIADDPDLTVQDKVRLAIDGDLKVGCSCPAFSFWGYKYINTQLDSNSSDPEERYPHVRNPKLTGVLCKHLYRALQVLPMNWSSISRDIENERWVS